MSDQGAPALRGQSFVERIAATRKLNLERSIEQAMQPVPEQPAQQSSTWMPPGTPQPGPAPSSPPASTGPTFGEIAERFYREVAEARYTPASQSNVRCMLRAHLLPAWGDTPINQIQKADIRELLIRVGTTRKYPNTRRRDGCQTRSNLVFWFLNRLFNWCIEDDENILDLNPCRNLKHPYPYGERERCLSDREIHYFWRATTELGHPYGTVAQLLLLTAQRRSEIANLQKTHVDKEGRLLMLPALTTKSRRAHLVPLSDMALDLINGVPKTPGCPFLFPGVSGVGPIGHTSFMRANKRIYDRMVAMHRADIEAAGGDPDETEMPWFVYQDLRRTAATVLCRLGHPLEVADKILNHANGRLIGRVNAVARIYIKHDFWDERVAALQDFADHIAMLAKTGGLTASPDISVDPDIAP